MPHIKVDSRNDTQHTGIVNPKAAVPVLLFSFVFCLIVDNGFKTMTGPMAAGLGIDPNTASLQASLAGVIIGIGAVVYAALADTISIRKLMLVGIALIAVGSLIGFVFSGSWPMVLCGRIIQTAGLAAAETLYVIYVTKHLSEGDQKTYLGFSTAAFQGGLLIGALTSGFISTYVSWTAMFLVPLILILAVPFIQKMVPEDETVEGTFDALGLFLVSVFAASLTMYMQKFNPFWLIPTVAGIAGFVAHVKKNKKALVSPEFFTNGRYVWAIVLVFVIYSTQLGFIFLLPFAASDVHGLSQDKAALLMVPGYVCAILVGVFSGAIGKVLSSRQTIYAALTMIFLSLVITALGLRLHIAVLICAIILFASGFALMYAPLVNTALINITAAKSGIAIGFYNLTINITIPLGIAYTAKLMDLRFGYSTILWVLAVIALLGAAIYVLADRRMSGAERARGVYVA
ncbi:MFS transporter [Corynebacterium pseudotuberculosis Cp162]|uniref:MFS transporter n=1 Tax=Corynebacterium pseudotuberculosis TaxID=1719 RepID=UPI0002660E6E|nr:MFS transporter [Corynebacterium pseudotuberculosis]AFM06543.1 MFS transporter [Corynebacterium pseudotuberculosis Cp162]APG80894.1 MFS-type drug efflux transporter [Corynebacterium pseudotuberculosis]WFP67374.1 MFS transporter [Corynebacterium pseudotuberculosis]